MKGKNYNEMNDVELANELETLKEQLFKMRFQHAVNQLANTSSLKECKRNIARVKTVINYRLLQAKYED